MQLTLWTYEGPPHIGAMRIATAMKGLHYVLHAPQGDTYADLLFTMIERRSARPPVTYTTFQARDLGGDTAELFKTACNDAYHRFQPQAMIVGASCTAELIQDDPGGLAKALALPVPVIPLELPSYQKKENWGASETFYQIVRSLCVPRDPGADFNPRSCNILGPTALGFRHRDDLAEITRLLQRMGIAINVVAPLNATPADIRRIPDAAFNVVLYPETAETTARWLERNCRQPTTSVVPIGVSATRDFILQVAKLAGIDASPVLEEEASRLPWYSRSVDSTYLTGKRVFIFGDATHALAAARIAKEELGFDVVGLGTYSREFARPVREAAAKLGLEALITDDYLEVEEKVAALQPELVLGTQMERHIAKKLGVPCAVISAPVHVQDFPARYSPQMGFEGANVIFDSWVHPLMMGLEEHLIHMFREDFEFNDKAAPSHLGHGAAKPAAPVAEKTASGWAPEAEKELQKVPFFVRGKAPSAASPSSPSRRCTMPKHTTAASTAMRVVIVTLDNHITAAVGRLKAELAREIPGLELSVHAASNWGANPASLEACRDDIARGDIIIATMLFMEDHIQAVMPALQARREACDAMVCFMSAGEVIKLTRMGRFAMGGSQGTLVSLLKKLRGASTDKTTEKASAGEKQLAMLKRIPKILRFIPGSAQDVRAYFLAMQYWLAGSEENIGHLVRFLVAKFAEGPRKALRPLARFDEPKNYPEVGVYHPRLQGRMSESAEKLPAPPAARRGTVGLLLMRSYVLSGDTAHYDGVIAAFESRGLKVIPAFATGLDQRPAIERFFVKDGRPMIDALVSLSGFSLVGGPAYNDARAAENILARLDVPYLAAQPVEFQTLEEWERSERGLHPIETTMMIAIPELDGAAGGVVFGGRSGTEDGARGMRVHAERASMLAARVSKLVALRQADKAERRLAIVLFNFPPNAGATGTAAFLSVFESLFNVMTAMKADGYVIDVPASVEELQSRVLKGNAERFGSDANVIHRIPVDDHVRRETYLNEIEAQWGPAPGRQQADGSSIHVLGERFGNLLVAIQPAFGYEGDPMRLLFERNFTPTHAFSAFYRYLREDFGASAVLHFGTHGALEFMPGKQSGLSAACWPDRLIGDLPNLYLYCANNPSEGTIAKRRSGATLVSYLTPPLAQAGLYRGLVDLKASTPMPPSVTTLPSSSRRRQPRSIFPKPNRPGTRRTRVSRRCKTRSSNSNMR